MGRLLCSSLILGFLTMASTTGDAQVFKPRSGTKSATSASSDRDRPKVKSGFRRRATKARAEEDTGDDAEESVNEDRPTSRRTSKRVDPSDDVEADRPRSRKSSKSSTDEDVEADRPRSRKSSKSSIDEDVEADRPRSRKSSKSSTDEDVEADDETTRPTKAGREKPTAAPKRWDPNFVLITDDDE